jgi:hypothetical protein
MHQRWRRRATKLCNIYILCICTSGEEEGQLKRVEQAHAHEEIALLESFFFRGKGGVKRKHQDTRLSKDELTEVFKSMLLALSGMSELFKCMRLSLSGHALMKSMRFAL